MKLNIERMYNRMEYNSWDLVINGTLNVPMNGPNGPTIYSDSYTVQTFTASPLWSSTSTATPLADLQTIQQKYVGHSVNFGAGAKLYMNQKTAYNFISNTNSADLMNFRNQFGATITNDLTVVNDFLKGRNLPSIVVYDEFFQTIPIAGVNTAPTTYNVQKYIPNGVAVLIGAKKRALRSASGIRPSMRSTPTEEVVHSFIKDSWNGVNASREVPGHLEVHNGFNGGIGFHFPLSVVSITC